MTGMTIFVLVILAFLGMSETRGFAIFTILVIALAMILQNQGRYY